MKRYVAVAAFVLIACCASSAANPAEAVVGNLIFLESSDAQGKLPKSKLAGSMAELVRAMKLPVTALPRVLVVHVSAAAGKAVGVKNCALRRNAGDLDAYYEFWIVGDANPADYTVAFERVLERHFALSLSDTERKRVITHVVRMVTATIDAHGE